MKTTIIQPTAPAQEIPAEILATAILKVAEGMAAINKTRITREAIVTLIHDYSKVPKRDVRIVLANLDSLERQWLKPKTVTK